MLPGAEGMPFLHRGGSGAGRLVEMRLPGRSLFSPAALAASAALQAGGGAPSAPGSIALGEANGPHSHGKIYSVILGLELFTIPRICRFEILLR